MGAVRLGEYGGSEVRGVRGAASALKTPVDVL